MMDPRLSAESKSIPPQLPADPPSHFIHFKTCRKTRGAGAQVTCGEKLTEQLALHIFTSGASSAHHLSWRGIGRPADLCPLGKGRQHRQHVQQHQFFSSVLKAPVHRRSRFPRLFIIPHSRGGAPGSQKEAGCVPTEDRGPQRRTAPPRFAWSNGWKWASSSPHRRIQTGNQPTGGTSGSSVRLEITGSRDAARVPNISAKE
ncbi:uncharacterized protein LOC130523359 isoform X2 [Takifugu flavidus]|uniref:uncharacterized protein LOC130523359 isoform X2 n=1 Tax=Takifugu flavidus TaxID=433684 RepID=UPI002544294B|nr:uncharacterized protein LOC130523359 isoform X2 [Takifugu flavidus]